MKKNLTRFFSLTLALVTTLCATAAPLQRRASHANSNLPELSTQATAAPTDVKNGPLLRPKASTASSKGLFKSSFKISNLNDKRPNKILSKSGDSTFPNLIGSVIYSENFSANGVYTIPTNSSQDFTRLFRYANAEYGGVLVDDTYFTCQYFEYPGYGKIIIYTGYDINTGKDYFEASGSYYTYSMTYDPTTSTVYAIANIEGIFALTKVNFDVEQNKVTFDYVGGIELDKFGLWNALACDSNGQLWAVYSDGDENNPSQLLCTGSTLYKIDKNTAAVTEVGETGFDSLYASDAIFDWKTDRMFWTVMNTDLEGFLTEIDTTTGEASVIYVFPGNEEVTGLAIPTPEAEDDAPAAVTDVIANFEKGSLSGSVDFKAPTTLFDGSEGSGEITYTVTANGEQVSTGTTTFGAATSAPVTVPTAGFYTFTVSVSNDKGESPKVETKAYVGADTPEATTVSASYNDGVMTVTWLPVTSSINGGYIDVDNMTYTVTRYPGRQVVANKISDTTFSENLPEPNKLTTYYYEVVAISDGLSSQPAQSNTVSIGSVMPPFTATFDDDSLDGFNVVNANGDEQTWSVFDGYARISFNKSVDMDDWLISPGLKLKGGTLYDVAAQFACGNPSYTERIEVKVGKSPKPEDMTIVLLEPTEIIEKKDAPYEWNEIFIPETDGTYYIGFHGISDMNKFVLYVDNISISEPKATNTPAEVTDLTVTPGANGALSATISFTTPAVTVSGGELTAITKIELLRDSRLINTWTNPAVNSPITYTDNLSVTGEYTYTVIAYNAAGNGPEAVASAYVGVDYPSTVSGVNAFETDTNGEVTITWDAVTTTEGGVTIDPSLVQYQVFRILNGSPVAISGTLDGTSFTYQAVYDGYQEFVQFGVVAKTERGYGKLVNASLSRLFPAGTPYHGITLTDEEDINNYILGVNSAGGGNWSVYDDSFFPSQDNDDRFFAMYGPFENSFGNLYTGLITLEGIANPGLTFYTYNIGTISGGIPDTNEIAIGVKEKGAEEFTTVETIVVSETGRENSWNRVIVDLSAYAGKTIQVNFYSIVKAAVYTLIDNIKIGTVYNNDLAVTYISAPDEVTTGSDFTVDVTVTNEGTALAESYNVELYSGKQLVATKAGDAIEGGISTIVEFDLTMSPIATEDVEYTAKVVLTGDENTDNDESKTVSVTPIASKLPAISDLAASIDGSAVKLTWAAPDKAAIPADAVTEDFEDGLSFSSHYGDWTFVDKDGSPVDGFSNFDVPNIVPEVTTGSFWLWDTNTVGSGSKYFAAHSGSKYLFALYRADMGQSNEWAISPELNGTAQTITFYAKSYSSDYPERIKLWYSTTTTNPDDFIAVETITRVSSDWTRYEFDVPAGAKYFAINSCATNAFMLMVDDVTYIPADAPVTTLLQGYDIYRNSVKINKDIVGNCEYADTDVEDNKNYEYEVVAVYNKGQSLPIAVSIRYQDTGIESALSDAISITSAKNSIIVNGAACLTITVNAADGKTMFTGKGEAQTVIPVQSGVYVVRAGQTVRKVLVK